MPPFLEPQRILSDLRADFTNKNAATTTTVTEVPAKSEKSPAPKLGSTWDKGLFGAELILEDLTPRQVDVPKDAPGVPTVPTTTDRLPEGTFDGTKKAATEMYQRIEQRFASYFDIANFESSIPIPMSLDDKQTLYTYQEPGSDKFPPHLNMIPASDSVSLLKIFNVMRLLDTGTLLGRVIPVSILDFIHSHPESDTIAGIEARNRTLRSEKKDIFKDPNIGDRDDWYSDTVFANQFFVGGNPTNIRLASQDWMQKFLASAKAQRKDDMVQLIAAFGQKSALYVVDNSYFRESLGNAPDRPIVSDDGLRFTPSPVVLFSLNDAGKLHPLAIVIDYKTSMDTSVVIFNKRLKVDSPTESEATDWPWRYAKTCVMASDWLHHEVTVHLVNTHFVEEASIVATHRSFPTDHIVYRLLEPHWLKTLSLNAAARSALVPEVIIPLAGMRSDEVFSFINDAYKNFDWTANYVPNELRARGFPVEQLNSVKFHNYAFARNIHLMWQTLRKFVAACLATVYTNDAQVIKDPAINAWTQTMRSPSGAQMRSFPDIKTVDALVDAVTMCIHLASPQHTAINYLQEYYQSFVINKPPALFAEPPSDLSKLLAYGEPDLMRALPANQPRDWLLASHLPYLLNYRVAEDQNILTYASSLANLAAQKGEQPILAAAKTLYNDLVQLKAVFEQNSRDLDDQTYPYTVLDPDVTAVSILI